MKEFVVPAGERTRVFKRFSSSLAQQIHLEVEPAVPGGRVSGTVEVQGSRWLFSKPAEMLPLSPALTVNKGYWDTRFSIWVVADEEVRVRVHRPRLR